MNNPSLSILMVHPHDFWYDPWTIRMLALARELKRAGHRVTLCHLPRKEKPPTPPIRHPQAEDPPIYELKPRQVHFVHNLKLLYTLGRQCDLIHLQKCFASTSLPVLWVSRLLRKPLHYDWDDHETAIARQVEPRRLSRLQLAIYERHLPAFAHTLTYSSQWIHNRAAGWGFPEERMRHLPVGADIDRFHPQAAHAVDLYRQWGLDTDQTTVLYIGQMEGAAHAHLLIEAAPFVLKQYPHTQFLLAGGGEQLEEMRDLAARSSAADSIFLPGYVAQEHIPSIITGADICVACFEDDEATRAKSPLKIAEYLASGKPIVASNVGEVAAMVGGCGTAVKAGSSEAIAEGILQYIQDEPRRFRDSIYARQKAERCFNWKSGMKTLEQCYTRLTADTRW